MKTSIKNKLLVSFGSVMVINGILGMLAIFILGNFIQTSSQINKTNFNMLQKIEESLKGLNLLERNVNEVLIYADNPNKVNDLVANIETNKSDLKSHLDELAPLITDSDGMKLFEEMKSNINSYFDVTTQIENALKVGNIESAKTYYVGGLTISNSIDSNIEALSKQINTLVNTLQQTSEKAFQTMRWILIGLVFGTILIGLVVGFFVSRNIARPLEAMDMVINKLAVGDLNRDMSDATKNYFLKMNDEFGSAARGIARIKVYMTEMADAAQKIADGDLTVKIQPKSEKDELGLAFAQMIQQLDEVVGKISENALRVNAASSQLADAANQSGQATNQIAATMQQVAKGTTDQADAISKTASAVEQMSQAIEGVAKGAQDQSNSVMKVSSATDQINSAIQQVAENAAAVSTDSAVAAEAARKGSRTVEQTLNGMQSIKTKVGVSAEKVQEMGRRSEEIGKIVETIEDIASQTNLLALNAAIEAARAGEHGKGFAVVADEVRKLAERSSLATKEIGGLISGILNIVSEAVKAMEEGSKEVELGVETANQAGKALTEILDASEAVNKQATMASEASLRIRSASETLVSAVDSVSAVVEENTASTEQMAANSAEVTQAIESIASVSEENSAAIEEVSASAEEMSAQVQEVTASAASLAEMAKTLEDIVSRFKVAA